MSFAAPQHHGADAHGTDRAASDPASAGHLDADLAWGHHLLLVGEPITPEDVEALALSRFDGASRRDEHTIDLVPGAWLTGPWALEEATRAALGLPAGAHTAYLARAPVLRAGPVPPELRGLGGLLDAFVEGTPEGVEAEVVEFLFAAARRLGGALRAGGTGVVLVPDPASFVDLLVHSPVWLEPEALQVVLDPILPGLQVLHPMLSAPVPMPPPAPQDLTDAQRLERAERQARADAIDAAALAAQQVHEGYGATWTLPGHGLISIQVEALESVPTVLLDTDWAQEGLLTYQVRWYPQAGDDETGPGAPAAAGGPDLDSSSAVVGSAAAVQQVRELIEQAAGALQEAVGGVIADDDGFLVHLDPAPADPQPGAATEQE